MRIIHIIPSLNSGGAETMLYKLIKNRQKEYDIEIVTLLSGGFYAEKIRALNIPIHELNFKNKKNVFKSITLLVKTLKRADIIQSWMYHSDLISLLFGKTLMKKKVIWGIRRSYLEKKHLKKRTYYIAKLCAYFSKYVDGIVSCTIVGKVRHRDFGYENQNFEVISNGFEINESYCNQPVDLKSPSKIKFLNIARWEPLKDHRNLLAALQKVKKTGIQFELLLVGNGIDENNKKLLDMIIEYDLYKEVKLLGVRNDIPGLMKNADIYVSSSLSEGFPNVIGEAMAAGLYCVATDAGDTKYLIDDFGILVEVGSPTALAEGILSAVKMDKSDLLKMKNQARKRIENEFSIQHIVDKYEVMYQKIMDK